MTSHKILSRHSSLSEAVEAAGIDLSYNEPLARRDIKRADKDVSEAYVLDVNSAPTVYYVFEARDITLLNRYDPFLSCLDNGGFRFAAVTPEGDEIAVTGGDVYRDQVQHIQSKYGDRGEVVWATKSFDGI